MKIYTLKRDSLYPTYIESERERGGRKNERGELKKGERERSFIRRFILGSGILGEVFLILSSSS